MPRSESTLLLSDKMRTADSGRRVIRNKQGRRDLGVWRALLDPVAADPRVHGGTDIILDA